MDLKAVVFDFDGVCIDTEKARFMSWQRIFESFGLELPLDEWLKNIGKATYVSDPFVVLQSMVATDLDRSELHRRHRESEIEIAAGLPVLPGVVERLREARSLGILCAVASSSSHNWVDGHLERRGLRGFFNTVVCREDTESHKPDPAPYIKALDRLGVNSENAVAVEDSPAGVASAKAAGLYCIAVPCSMTLGMDLSVADRLVGSLEEVLLAGDFF